MRSFPVVLSERPTPSIFEVNVFFLLRDVYYVLRDVHRALVAVLNESLGVIVADIQILT